MASGDYGYFMDTLSGRRLLPNTNVILVEPDGRKIPIDINAQGFRDEEIPKTKIRARQGSSCELLNADMRRKSALI